MEKQKVYLVGIGMGGAGTLTEKGRELIEKSQIIIGANRMVEPFLELAESQNKRVFVSYQAREIGEYLRGQLKEGQEAAVLLSGDVGFSSGARKLLEELGDFQVELIPGITTMVYFCSRLGISWENVCFASGHGRKINMIQRIQRHKLCFFLLEGQKGLQELCDKLIYYGMETVRLQVGENLSYDNEAIIKGTPEEIREHSFGNLLVVLVENQEARDLISASIPDEEFLRGRVPMTKSEVRHVSIGKLGLTSDAVVYDVGAGTGSVAIEMALSAPEIRVYAIEKKPEALELLCQNKRKFGTDNMEIIEGTAPAALELLPSPTHVFVGGSSGELERIIDLVFQKNPKCRIVVNTIALNSLNQLLCILEKHREYACDIVQLQTSVAKQLGEYQLMQGQNPIYIITIWKES